MAGGTRSRPRRRTDLPISAIVNVGPLVAASGVVAFDERGHVSGRTIQAQTARALSNLQANLATVGVGLDNVIKTTVFLRRASDFEGMNAVYRKVLQAPFPARTTVVAKLVRPDLLVEIDALAWRGDRRRALSFPARRGSTRGR